MINLPILRPRSADTLAPGSSVVAVVVPVPMTMTVLPTVLPVAASLWALRHDVLLVPVVIDEIHRVRARMIFMAMLLPAHPMTGRHPQVSRLRGRCGGRWRRNQDRLRRNDLGLRILANVNAAVHARLAKLNGDADVGRLRSTADKRAAGRCENDSLHFGIVTSPEKRS